MPRFSKRSQQILDTCDWELRELMYEVVRKFDITVLEGYRSSEDQEAAFKKGNSKLRAGQSKHNYFPSLAVDVAPWKSTKPHIDWDDLELFRFMGGYILGIANQMEINVRWGGDWDGDFNFRDQTLIDMPHFELVR